MDRDEVIKNIRACLISSKGGVKIDELSRDYKMLIEENIPFRKLGYHSLIEFLRNVPSIRITEKGNECFVEAMLTEESAHISKLIAQQKIPPKKCKTMLNARKPFRKPLMTKGHGRSSRTANGNAYSQTSGRQNPPMLTRINAIHGNNGKPRYIQTNCGMPPYAPSNRLKEKQMRAALSSNQIANKQKGYLQQAKYNKKPPVMNQKFGNNNVEALPKKTLNLSERLKVNLHNSATIPSQQSEVLSPLSPRQVLTDGFSPLVQQSSTNSVPLNNSKNVTRKSELQDPREQLKERAAALNLSEPIYQICPTMNKNAKGQFIFAQVKIGPHGYSSYPEEARTVDEAQRLAARFALVDLTDKYGLPSRLNETKDKSVIMERVLQIVEEHRNGIFMHQVPVYYKQHYKEVLPGQWERFIETCPSLAVENGVDNSIILRPVDAATEKARNAITSKMNKVQLHPIGPAVPGSLQLPEEDIWVVSVISIISTAEIWVRIVDDAYSEQFEIMTTKMTEHYKQNQLFVKPMSIETGNYYVVCEDELYHRVRCLSYDSTSGMVSVYFIDHGDEDTFHYSKLQMLDKKFCALPAQALRLSLSGLEDFSDCDSVTSQIEKLLFDRALYVEVVTRNKDQDGPSAAVVFYDTNGPFDINLNSEISKLLLQNTVIAPKLDEEGQVAEVFVSHVEENGDVYIQVQSESMKLLVSLLNRLIGTGLNTEDLENCIVTTIDASKAYFVSVKNNWYRGKIVEMKPCGQLRTFLIDFGKTVTADKSSLLCLERLSETLAIFPAQALKVHLHNIEKSMFNEKMVTKFLDLAPHGEPLLIKVVSRENNVPVVELFKRIQPSNMLVSINSTLSLEDELTKTQGDGNNNVKPRKRIERLNSKLSGTEDDQVKSLKPPQISGFGEFFDVHVTMAAHPGNFTVQPFDDKCSLERMMIQLQEICQAYTGPAPSSESVREGKLYAAKHIDGHWYRVCISSMIKEDMVSVYFCDFGDVSVLPLDKLQPLRSQFLQLPYQAIKARLAGIRPVNVDWSVEDSLRFQELVVDKNFVSLVVESVTDGPSPVDTILGLKLIDVTTSEDIYIDQLLVKERRAVFTV